MSSLLRFTQPCPFGKEYGATICKDGYLWELTYSEMGPPGSRQDAGPCLFCRLDEAMVLINFMEDLEQ